MRPFFTITTEFKFEILANRLRELAFLNPGLEIQLSDEREEEKSERFFYKDGIGEFVRQLGRNKHLVHQDPINLQGVRSIDVEGKQEEAFVDCVVQ